MNLKNELNWIQKNSIILFKDFLSIVSLQH